MAQQLPTNTYTPRTLLGLPTELRLEIFDLIFRSTIVGTDRGYARTNAEIEELESDDYAEGISRFELTPLPSTPQDILSLRLTCRTFASEISGDNWHSVVTYDFPSTVAFIDVLSQWPQTKIETLRNVKVVDSPLALYPYNDTSCYHVSSFDVALPIFPGLQLDTLTVQDLWLYADGSQTDGWCGTSNFHAINQLLQSSGWKRFYYQSGTMGLCPSQLRKINSVINEKREKDFFYEIRGNRPNLCHMMGESTEEDEREVEAWYAARPEEGKMGEFREREGGKYGITVASRRGEGVEVKQTGEGVVNMIRELVEKIGWVELRKWDRWLVNDGLDDPQGHL